MLTVKAACEPMRPSRDDVRHNITEGGPVTATSKISWNRRKSKKMLRHAGRTSLALVETYFRVINGTPTTVVPTKTANLRAACDDDWFTTESCEKHKTRLIFWNGSVTKPNLDACGNDIRPSDDERDGWGARTKTNLLHYRTVLSCSRLLMLADRSRRQWKYRGLMSTDRSRRQT